MLRTPYGLLSSILLGNLYNIRWLTGDLQYGVLVVLQHIKHIALTASFRDLTLTRERLIFCILQLSLQMINLNDILLTGITVADIQNGKESYQQDQPNLATDSCRIEDVSTQDFRKVWLLENGSSPSCTCSRITSCKEGLPVASSCEGCAIVWSSCGFCVFSVPETSAGSPASFAVWASVFILSLSSDIIPFLS